MSNESTKTTGLEPATVCKLADLAVHNNDSIVSRTLVKSPSGSLTLFAFDTGQHLSEHTCPYDATAYVIEGAAEIVIGGNPLKVSAGQVVLMPANVPHAVNARQEFKMLLTMFKADRD